MKNLIITILFASMTPAIANATKELQAGGIYSTFQGFVNRYGQVVAFDSDRANAEASCLDTRNKIMSLSNSQVVFKTNCQEDERFVIGENHHTANTVIRLTNPNQRVAKTGLIFAGPKYNEYSQYIGTHQERCAARASLLRLLSSSEVSIVAKCIQNNDTAWLGDNSSTKLEVLVIRN